MSNPSRRSSAAVACPDCGSPIPPHAILFDFQFSTGDRGVIEYAECPGCDAIVHPIVRREGSG